MEYSLVGIPQEQDLRILNNLRNYVYQNNFRFKNKPLDSDTHITLTNVVLSNDEEIEKLKQALLNKILSLKQFSVSKSEWILMREEKEPNDKIDSPYTWIALKFPQRREIYEVLDRLAKDIGMNNNAEYVRKIKEIEGDIPNDECIANHVNLSNYTKREMGEKCWEYFNCNLPGRIIFDKVALRNQNGGIEWSIILSSKSL